MQRPHLARRCPCLGWPSPVTLKPQPGHSRLQRNRSRSLRTIRCGPPPFFPGGFAGGTGGTVTLSRAAFHSRNQPSRNLVNMNMAANTKPCLLCGNSATGNNRSSEHIVPAALGGTRTVSGFICRQCNSDAGRSCDTALARSFEGLTRLLDISRKKSLPRAQVTDTSDDTPIRVLPGNRMVFGHTTEQEITEGNRRILRITAASEDELRKSVQKIKDRRNLDLDVAAFVEEEETHPRLGPHLSATAQSHRRTQGRQQAWVLPSCH